jgi:hypothetical protein
MRNNKANIVVDLKQIPSRKHVGELERELGMLSGVSRARASARARRLVLVDYDPTVTDSQQILGAVGRRGWDARLIGM